MYWGEGYILDYFALSERQFICQIVEHGSNIYLFMAIDYI